MIRKNIHYFFLSLIIHLSFFLIFWLIKGPELPYVKERKVRIEFSKDRQIYRPEHGPEKDHREQLVPADKKSIQGSGELPVPGRITVHQKSADLFSPSDLPPERLKLKSAVEQAFPEQTDQEPVSDDIIHQVLSSLENFETEPVSTGITEPGALEWKGKGRKLLSAPELKFPEILIQEGREVDIEVSFTVAPNGRVIEVEITRSSGYTQVDRAVERVLLDYLFEESSLNKNDFGVIRFYFKLERSN